MIIKTAITNRATARSNYVSSAQLIETAASSREIDPESISSPLGSSLEFCDGTPPFPNICYHATRPFQALCVLNEQRVKLDVPNRQLN